MTAEAIIESSKSCAEQSRSVKSQIPQEASKVSHIVVCNALGVGHYQPVAALVTLLARSTTPVYISFFAVVRKQEEAKCTAIDGLTNVAYRKYCLEGDDVHPVTMRAMITRLHTLVKELDAFIKSSCETNCWGPVTFVVHDTFALFAREWVLKHNIACAIFNPSNCFFWVVMETRALFEAASKGIDSVKIHPDVPSVRAQLVQLMIRTEAQAPEDEQEPVFKMYPNMDDLCGHSCAVIGSDVFDLYPWAFKEHISAHEAMVSSRPLSGFADRKDCPYKYYCVGPLCLADGGGESADEELGLINGDISLRYWLDQKEDKSVIFVALGTLYKMKREVLEALFESLKHCPFSFVWSYREMHSPPALTPAMLASLPLEKGVIIPWVKQKYLLMHPALRLFISHCGWNSTLENMCYGGIPTLCLPMGSDQIINTIMICDVLKCGRLGMIQNEEWKPETMDSQNKYKFPEKAVDFSKLIREAADLYYKDLLLQAKEVQIKVLKAGSHRGSMIANVEKFIKFINDVKDRPREFDEEYERHRSRVLLMTK